MATFYASSVDEIRAALSDPEIDEIKVAPGDYYVDDLDNGQGFVIDRDVAIVSSVDGERANFHARADFLKGIFLVNSGASAIFDGIGFFDTRPQYDEFHQGNEAAIRHEGDGLTIRNSHFEGNSNAILGSDVDHRDNKHLIVEDSTFVDNGRTSQEHHIYFIGNSVTVTGSSFVNSNNGHAIKTVVSDFTKITDSIIADGDAPANHAINVTGGGDLIVSGNTITKSATADNPYVIFYIPERGYDSGEIIIENNTIHTDWDGSTGGTVLLGNYSSSVAQLSSNTLTGSFATNLVSGLAEDTGSTIDGRVLSEDLWSAQTIKLTAAEDTYRDDGDLNAPVYSATVIKAVDGGDGDDTLIGQSDDRDVDVFLGGLGNDYIDGGGGVDFLYGGEGDDIILTGTSASSSPVDFASGGDGNDWITVGSDSVSDTSAAYVVGGQGDDFIDASRAYYGSFLGDAGNDIILGASYRDWLNGGSGDDVLYGGTEYDVLEAGDGIDTVVYAGSYGIDLTVEAAFRFGDVNIIALTEGNQEVGGRGSETAVNAEYIQFANGVLDTHTLAFTEGAERFDLAAALDRGIPMPDLILNGSFESGLEGWTLGGGQTDRFFSSAEAGFLTTDGRDGVPLGGWSRDDGQWIEQTIATQARQGYTLTFDAGVNVGRRGTLLIEAIGADGTVLTERVTDDGLETGLANYSFDFIANADTTDIRFSLEDGRRVDFDVDNITLRENSDAQPDPNLLENGWFEHGVLGWTLGGGQLNRWFSPGEDSDRTSDGEGAVPLGGWSREDGQWIEQSIVTQARQGYTLTFDAGVNFGWRTATLLVEVSGADGSVLTQRIMDNGREKGLESYSFDFFASGETSDIRFTLEDGPRSDFDIDNVSIERNDEIEQVVYVPLPTVETTSTIEGAGWLYGTDQNDLIKPSSINVAVFGYEGDDVFSLTGQAQRAVGGGGNDVFYAHDNYHTLTGGEGADSFILSGPFADARITDFNVEEDSLYFVNGVGNLMSVGDVLDSAIETTAGVEIVSTAGTVVLENINLSDFRTSFIGTAVTERDPPITDLPVIETGELISGPSWLYGTDGNDRIETGANNIVIAGYAGDDHLSISHSYSRVEGGAGNDLIEVRARDTVLLGGQGNDTFYFTEYLDGTVRGYEPGNDIIALDGAILNISDVSELMARLETDVHGNAILSDPLSDDTLVFEGVAASRITEDDFLIL